MKGPGRWFSRHASAGWHPFRWFGSRIDRREWAPACARATGLAGALIAVLFVATPVHARDSLGVYERWGAFRDPDTPRCYAIARPARSGRGEWQPFASIGSWPRRGVFNQVHIRLREPMREGEGATLTVGEREFELVGRGPDAWARDRTEDAAIVAAIRAGQAMRIRAATTAGRLTDRYDLDGAASAIDAAALGCAG